MKRSVIAKLKAYMKKLIVNLEDIFDEKVKITSRILSPAEAIGDPGSGEFALTKGDERLIEAKFRGAIGQAFTDHPSNFTGSIEEVLSLDLSSQKNKALFIASLNAILAHFELVNSTVHCKDDGPRKCSWELRHLHKEALLRSKDRNYWLPTIFHTNTFPRI